MSHEGEQERERPQKDLQPLGAGHLSEKGDLLPGMWSPVCCLWRWHIREPRSRQTKLHGRPDLLKNEPEEPLRWCTLPSSMDEPQEHEAAGGFEEWWDLYSCAWTGWSHTHLEVIWGPLPQTHKGVLVWALVLTSPNLAQTSVWLECAGGLPGFSGRTSSGSPLAGNWSLKRVEGEQ